MVKKLDIYIHDEDDPECIKQDVAQLDNLENGSWPASVFRRDPDWLRIALKHNKNLAAEMILDDMGVPGDGMNLKQRVALVQLVDLE